MTSTKALLTPLWCLPYLCQATGQWTLSESSSCALWHTWSRSQVHLPAPVRWKGYEGRALVIPQDQC